MKEFLDSTAMFYVTSIKQAEEHVTRHSLSIESYWCVFKKKYINIDTVFLCKTIKIMETADTS